MQELLNSLFDYVEGTLVWKPLQRRGFNKSGQEAGSVNKGRVFVKSNLLPKKNFARSQIIWIMHNGEIPVGMFVDHKDRNPLNDKISNLRLLTNAQNCANTLGKSTKKSGLPKGVYKCTAPNKYRFKAQREGQIVRKSSLTLKEATAFAKEFFNNDSLFVKEDDL